MGGEKQRNAKKEKKKSDGEIQLEGGRGEGEGFQQGVGWRMICFSPSASLYDTRKSDSYHNGRMNHSYN